MKITTKKLCFSCVLQSGLMSVFRAEKGMNLKKIVASGGRSLWLPLRPSLCFFSFLFRFPISPAFQRKKIVSFMNHFGRGRGGQCHREEKPFSRRVGTVTLSTKTNSATNCWLIYLRREISGGTHKRFWSRLTLRNPTLHAPRIQDFDQGGPDLKFGSFTVDDSQLIKLLTNFPDFFKIKFPRTITNVCSSQAKKHGNKQTKKNKVQVFLTNLRDQR